MNNNFIKYQGTTYYIDIEALFNCVFTSPKDNGEDFTKSINQVYDTENENAKLEIAQKQIVETTNTNNELAANLRYDFLVGRALNSVSTDEYGNDFDVNEPTFIQSVYFNTLIKAGILVAVKE